MSGKPDERPGFDRRMTKQEINHCPVTGWEGPVEIVRSAEQLKRAVQVLKQENLLGFDTETRPAFTKRKKYAPSLLQLAGQERVYLFQLKHCGLQASLIDILADPGIIKTGVSLAFDLKELKTLAPFKEAGFAELGIMARERGIINNGLRGLAAVILGRRITKSAQTSNWAKNELTRAQVRYAATDAWIGREIYLALQKRPEIHPK